VNRWLYSGIVYLNSLSVFYFVLQIISESSRRVANGLNFIITCLRGTACRAWGILTCLVLDCVRHFRVIFKSAKGSSPVVLIHENLNQLPLIKGQKVSINLEQTVQIATLLVLRSRWVEINWTAVLLGQAFLNLVEDFLKMVQIGCFLEGRVCSVLGFIGGATDSVLSFASTYFLVCVAIVWLRSCWASTF